MTKPSILSAASALVLGIVLSKLALATDELDGIKNLKHPAPGFVTGGQPSTEQINAMSIAGITRVINLRPESEIKEFREAEQVRGAGMVYSNLPIDGAGGLTLANVRRLDEYLKAPTEGITFMHCSSGNRVGALIALHAALIEGRNTEAAIRRGKAWGLTRLEGEVRRLLGEL